MHKNEYSVHVPKVVTRLQVILPGHTCSAASLILRQTEGVDLMDTDDDNVSPLDSKILAQHLAAKHKAGSGSDEAPLLTNAIRLLEKAKKEKVYSSCVVRIRYDFCSMYLQPEYRLIADLF